MSNEGGREGDIQPIIGNRINKLYFSMYYSFL
jgi:hypothetical protein